MPKYTIEGPDGRRVTVEGDSPPTEQEMAQIFASLPKAAPKRPTSTAAGAGLTALQGATFGFADEIMGAMANSRVPGSGDLLRAEEARQREAFQQENPKTALAAEIAGALPTGIAGASRAAALPVIRSLGPVAKSAAIGGIEAAVYGAGTAEEGERLPGAAAAGVIGATAGAAAPFLAPLAARVGSWVDRVASSVRRTDESRALERIAKAFADDDVTPSQVRGNLDELSEGRTIMDAAGANTRGLVEQGAQTPGAARRIAEERLLSRNQDLPENLRQGVVGLNRQVTDLENARAEIVRRRSEQAAPIYDAAYRTEINNGAPVLQNMAKNPEVASAMKKAVKDVESDVTLPDFVKAANDPDAPGIALWDATKKRLDDRIGKAQRAGKNNEARRLTAIKNRILAELDEQVPEYAQARRVWEDDTKIINAMDAGLDAFSSGKKGMTAQEYRALSAAEQDAFALGAARAMYNAINSTGRNLSDELQTGVFNRLFGSDQQRALVKEIFGAESADEFAKLVKSEKLFRANSGEVLRGSPTARREGLAQEAADVASVAADVASAGAGSMVATLNAARNMLSRIGRRSRPGVDEAVVDTLTSSDAQVIKQALDAIENPPGWFNGLRKMNETQMSAWLKNPANKSKLETALAGSTATSAAAASQ